MFLNVSFSNKLFKLYSYSLINFEPENGSSISGMWNIGSEKFMFKILFKISIIMSNGVHRNPSRSENQFFKSVKYVSKKPSSGTNNPFKPSKINSTNFFPKKFSENGFIYDKISPIRSKIFLFIFVFSSIASCVFWLLLSIASLMVSKRLFKTSSSDRPPIVTLMSFMERN